jgi:hypothetical protein
MSEVKPYVIRKGDYLTKLGHEMGFDPAYVWSHPRNAELVKKRKNQEILKAGDVLWVPDEARRRLPLEVESSNTYVARVPTVPLKLTLKLGGKVLKKEPYVLRGLGKLPTASGERKDEIVGETDDEGRISLEPNVHVREVEIVLTKRKKELRLFIAGIAPDNELSGLRARLKNLGYLGAKHQGAERYEALDPAMLEAAIRAFQGDFGLAVDGKITDALRAKILEVHGS